MDHSSQEFIEFALKKQVLQFGQFKTKAGRLSPYFFNTGLFNDGESLMKLGMFYAKSIENSNIPFDMLYGPAYKGIPLVTSIVIAFASLGRNVPFAFNRKEKKDHGEGLKGRVLIVDDVISAGTSVNESVNLILEEGAQPSGIAISIDREEKGSGSLSAVEEIKATHHLPVCHLTSLKEIMRYIESKTTYASHMDAMRAYQKEYGI
ncbi:MAG: orotate phosphoribosyltransferase [Betaproteobacteria bacterium]|nr:orotate phosphoribosyltransferase [Betaproteobacteria bacterium]